MNQNTPPHNNLEFNEDFLEWEERDESVPYLAHCVAGSLAGITEHVTMLPFDTIKTHMQIYEGKYTAVQTAQQLYKTEGIGKFWRGAPILASGCIPAHALYFSVYEFSKRMLLPRFHDQNDELYVNAYALTGALATSVHDLVLTPFDMLKQRAQIAPSGLTNLRSLFAYIVKKEGFLSLYRGYPITLMMNVPQAAAIVSVNESLKVLYKPADGHNVFTYFICAGIAGSVAATFTIPLDNIKTRLQTQTFFNESRKDIERLKPSLDKMAKKMNLFSPANLFSSSFATTKENPLNPTQIKYNNILSTMRTIFREEGVRGFFKGVVPRIIAQAPASAISWTTYEMMKKLLQTSKLY